MSESSAFEPIPYSRGSDMSKAEIAELMGESIATIDEWVRKGCPVRRTGSVENSLVFDSAQVIAWRMLMDAESGGPDAVLAIRIRLGKYALESQLEKFRRTLR